ncbi:MAG: hypothetical protein HY721_19375 [Planctomycetes bacterium]|nr:hypothetical protein [Planctomycetota bacterium]
MSRELWVRPEADLAGILESHAPCLTPRTLDPVFLLPEMKRFLVRGHWRRANPDWKDQRIRWIEPYWKGSDIARVIEKQYLLRP